jgi:hypothetical protein
VRSGIVRAPSALAVVHASSIVPITNAASSVVLTTPRVRLLALEEEGEADVQMTPLDLAEYALGIVSLNGATKYR